MSLRTFVSPLTFLGLLGLPSVVAAQVYFTAPQGEGGTWNLYELRGANSAELLNPRIAEYYAPRGTWVEAQADAVSRTESVAGRDEVGHLVSIGSAAENRAIRRAYGQIFWIGLTDDPAFGGGETASSPPKWWLDGPKGLHGDPGDGVGWKWSNGDRFDYLNWEQFQPDSARGDEDYVFMNQNGKWEDGSLDRGDGRPVQMPWIVEYETRMPADFAVPEVEPRNMPGPSGGWGVWGVREVIGNGRIPDVFAAMNSLLQRGPEAVVRDYQTPELSFNDVRNFRDMRNKPSRHFEVSQRGDAAPGAVDHLSLLAHGTIRIPEGRGGRWEFQVRSDDGFELYVPGKRFERSDATTSYGSLILPGVRMVDATTGSIDLEPGDYGIELVYLEHEGLAELEVSARGPGDDAFALVGDPGLELAGNSLSAMGYGIQRVRRGPDEKGAPPFLPTSLADARAWLASPGRDDIVETETSSSLDYGDAGSSDTAYAMTASSRLVVTVAGEYSLGFDTSRGAELHVAGATFEAVFGQGRIGVAGDSLVADAQPGSTLTWGSLWLEPGEYPLELLTYGEGGAGYAALFSAPGKVENFGYDAFRLLDRRSRSVEIHRPAGLPLVPEPTTATLTMFGFLSLTVVARRRNRPVWASQIPTS